jgi:hypothetical protein
LSKESCSRYKGKYKEYIQELAFRLLVVMVRSRREMFVKTILFLYPLPMRFPFTRLVLVSVTLVLVIGFIPCHQ